MVKNQVASLVAVTELIVYPGRIYRPLLAHGNHPSLFARGGFKLAPQQHIMHFLTADCIAQRASREELRVTKGSGDCKIGPHRLVDTVSSCRDAIHPHVGKASEPRARVERIAVQRHRATDTARTEPPPSSKAIKRVERLARDAQHLRTWLATNPEWPTAAVASPQQRAR